MSHGMLVEQTTFGFSKLSASRKTMMSYTSSARLRAQGHQGHRARQPLRRAMILSTAGQYPVLQEKYVDNLKEKR